MQFRWQALQQNIEANVRALFHRECRAYVAEIDERILRCLLRPRGRKIEHKAAHHLLHDYRANEHIEDQHRVALSVLVEGTQPPLGTLPQGGRAGREGCGIGN